MESKRDELESWKRKRTRARRTHPGREVKGNLIQGPDGLWRTQAEARRSATEERRVAKEAWLDSHPVQAVQLAMVEMVRIIKRG